MCFSLSYRSRSLVALTVIRIMLGAIFIVHGGQKVFGFFGGPGLAGFATWLGTYGLPTSLAYLAAFAEFIGGFLLLSGYFIELGALMTSSVMLGAIFIIHWPHFFVQNGGFEYPLSLIITTVATVYGLSGWKRKLCGEESGACDEDECCKEGKCTSECA